MKKLPTRTGFVKFKTNKVVSETVHTESIRKMSRFSDNIEILDDLKKKAAQVRQKANNGQMRSECKNTEVVNSKNNNNELGIKNTTEMAKELIIDNLDEFNCIKNVFEHENVLVCSPQRYRNVIYQTSGKLLKGACIVITQCEPLLNNQYEQLRILNIPCCILNMQDSIDQNCKFIFINLNNRIEENILRIIEKLENFSTISEISLIVLQDTQLIINYSEEYRSKYKRVSELRSHFPSSKFLCLSTPLVNHEINSIQDFLGIDFYLSKFDPVIKEVTYRVNESKSQENIAAIIQEHYLGKKGLIFFSNNSEIRNLCDTLNTKSLKCTFVHRDLKLLDKRKNINSWKDGKFNILIVASLINIDFNIEDVQFVIHYGNLKSIQDCVTEISYSGCAKQPLDYHIFHDSCGRHSRSRFGDENKESDYVQVDKFIKSLTECRKVAIFKYFGIDSEPCNGFCDVCIKVVGNAHFDLPNKRNRS